MPRYALTHPLIALAALLLLAACSNSAPEQPAGNTQGNTQNAAAPTTAPAETTGAVPPKEGTPDRGSAADASFDHAAWDALLKKFVTEDGFVRYKQWKEDPEATKQLDAYLLAVAEKDAAKLSSDSRLAFWINGYNALAIRGILNAYPVASVEKVPGLENFAFFKTPKHKIGGLELTLDEIENEKIRKDFQEPRIHFVLNCTAVSCPPIQRDALTKMNMDEVMDRAARDYIRKQTQVDTAARTVATSQIFEWFRGDFEREGQTLQTFLADYLDGDAAEITRSAKAVTFTPYKWDLNEARE